MSTEKSSPKKRYSWDEYFMNIAQLVATRATCNRGADLKYMPGFKGVGAIIVKENVVLSTGYNGSPRGLDHCDEIGHEMVEGHCIRTVHAEANALVQAARNGVAIIGGTIYTTASPCYDCFKMLVNAGISRIVCGSFYGSRYGASEKVIALSAQAGIKLEFFQKEEHSEEAEAPEPNLFKEEKKVEIPADSNLPLELKVKAVHPSAIVPNYAHNGDAGLDLFAVEGASLEPGARTVVKTGISLEIPKGYAGLIWDRSGLSIKKGLKTLAGVIDSSYRGEIMIGLVNISNEVVEIISGDKIAQILIQPVKEVKVSLTDELSDTERGGKGFGSTDTEYIEEIKIKKNNKKEELIVEEKSEPKSRW